MSVTNAPQSMSSTQHGPPCPVPRGGQEGSPGLASEAVVPADVVGLREGGALLGPRLRLGPRGARPLLALARVAHVLVQVARVRKVALLRLGVQRDCLLEQACMP